MGKNITIDTSNLPRCPTCGRLAPEGMKALGRQAGKYGGLAKNPNKGFGNPEVKAKMIAANKARFAEIRAKRAVERAERKRIRAEEKAKMEGERNKRRYAMEALEREIRDAFREEKRRWSAEYLNTSLAQIKDLDGAIGQLVKRAAGEEGDAGVASWINRNAAWNWTLREAIKRLVDEIYAPASKLA